MSKNINTFAAGLLALTSIAAASVGCQPQASEQTAANPTEYVEQTETVDATETEAASTFEPTEEPTDEPTAEPTAEPTEESTAVPAWATAHIPSPVDIQFIENRPDTYAVCVIREDKNYYVEVWQRKIVKNKVVLPPEVSDIVENVEEISYSQVRDDEAILIFLNKNGTYSVLIKKKTGYRIFPIINWVISNQICQIHDGKHVIFCSLDWEYFIKVDVEKNVHFDENLLCWLTDDGEFVNEEEGEKIKI